MNVNIKSFVSKFTSLAICLSFSTITVFSQSQSTNINVYDPCDVNQDGAVNVTDISLLNSYLKGNRKIDDNNRLDANHSMTVDYADVLCISAKLQSSSYNAVFYSDEENLEYDFNYYNNSFAYDYLASSIEPITYLKHNNITTTTDTEYVLTPTSVGITSGSNNEITSIIGDDDLQPHTGQENKGIVRLSFNIGNTSYKATGFIVGNHQIATAAHCVYNRTTNSWATNMKYYTYNTNGSPNTTSGYNAVELHIPKSYKLYGNNKYDYALITVSENLSSSSFQTFDLGVSYNVNYNYFSDVPIHVAGFPVNNYIYYDEGRIVGSSNANDSVLFYNTDTNNGESGGPVYVKTRITINGQEQDRYVALAIHHGVGVSGVSNCGSRITKCHLQFYKNNPNINY